jgi:hypothetical protein
MAEYDHDTLVNNFSGITGASVEQVLGHSSSGHSSLFFLTTAGHPVPQRQQLGI